MKHLKMSYEEKFKITQKILNCHTTLDESIWAEIMKDEMGFKKSYEEVKSFLEDDHISFRIIWEHGMYIWKKKAKLMLSNCSKIYIPTEQDILTHDWVIA